MTNDSVVVRRGMSADVMAVSKVVFLADAARTSGSRPVEENARARTTHRLGDPRTFFFVAERSGGVIGSAAGMSGRSDGGLGEAIPGLCHISMVAVLPELWGQGIGRQLLSALVDEARDRGYERVQLFTQADNARGHALYERLGFSLTGQVAVSSNDEPIVHYLLPLRS
ncbi:GNAT family N-acetyltransferase [Spirillospora sp. NPDC048911]|uniref:GNAT family N-acetyltransferase n=1 Tax=Spirillospora sp. NPDC048911 TaxID=3364527 RepID=UPI00371E1045